MKHNYTVILRKEPQEGYTVIVPALPGCLTEGQTVGEALLMAQDAIQCYLESLAQHGEPIPPDADTLSFERGNMEEGFIFRVSAELTETALAHA